MIDKVRLDSLQCALHFKRKIVGIQFYSTTSEFESSHFRTVRNRLSFCMMVKVASRGTCIKVSESNFKCPGSRRALGIDGIDHQFRSGEKYLGLGLYQDVETAKSVADEMLFLDKKTTALAVGPIEQFESPPDAVIIIADGYTAMRVVQGYTYHFGQAKQIRFCGNQGVCCELTSRPFMLQDMNISLLCANTRFSCKWRDGEIGIGLPYHQLQFIIDGVIKTLNVVEPDSRKKEIINCARSKGIDLGVVPGANYYSHDIGIEKSKDRR